MRKSCYGIIVLTMLICPLSTASAQVSIGIGLPNLSIGINLPVFPELVPVPGYPVYYAPRLDANYFFYDGMYWVFMDDNWYASSWYNGPWALVDPFDVPLFILRIPVRYYRHAPAYFHGWRADAPPHWGKHWGHEWQQRRSGWNKWDHRSAPAHAPLPVYQRQYSRDRYPGVEQQQRLRSQHYRYQPHENIDRRHFNQRFEQRPPVPAQRGRTEGPAARTPRQEYNQRSAPAHTTPEQRGPAFREQRPQPGAVQHEQRTPGTEGRKYEERGQEHEERGR